MKKKLPVHIFTFALCLIFVFLFFKSFCVTASAESNYTITSYDIDMVVNEDNTFDITENITVDFHESSHGIYRKIPLKNSLTSKNGLTSSNRAKVSNVDVSEEFKLSKEDGYQIIKVGSSDSTFTGVHSYTISYTYNMGKDTLKYADGLFFYLIGDEWSTAIENVKFKITMPKKFDKSSLNLSCGWNSNQIVYSVNGNEISGYLTDSLRSGDALTVMILLPEGYFVGASSNMNENAVTVMLFCGICVLTAAVLWFIFGRDSRVIDDSLRYYPPKGWNPAEVGLCYYGRVKTGGIISLVIYLAGKGYLKLRDIARVGASDSNRRLVIVKLREYDGNNECERLFINGLFKSGEAVGDAVSILCLQEGFYETYKKIKLKLNSKEVKRLLFEPSSTNKIPFLVVMAVSIYIAITALPMLEYGDVSSFVFALLLTGAGFSVTIVWLMGKIRVSVQCLLISSVVLGFLTWFYKVLPCLRQDTAYIAMYIIGVVSIAIIIMFIEIMPKRTQFAHDMYGEIKGFRRFLETAENSRLEMFMSQNPEYFYDIWPYANALGLSDKWIGRLKFLDLQYPKWYSSYISDYPSDFCYLVDIMLHSAQRAMSVYMSPMVFIHNLLSLLGGDDTYYSDGSSGGSSSGGGFSGGGSSGGGSGGGGGGSW